MAIEEPIAESVIVATDAVAPEEKHDVRTGEKPKKVKKPSVRSKPKSPSLHPPYFEMIMDAIITLKERTGSSQYAITKFIEEKQKNLPANFKKVLLTQLKKFVAAGKLTKVKASYKLPAKSSATTALAKKKPGAAKSKSVVKKAPGNKKSVAKPKPTAKLKAVGKPKAVAKPKSVVKSKTAAKPKSIVKPSAKPKTAAAAKVKPKTTTSTKLAKVARTSARSTPGIKATAAPKMFSKKTPVKKVAVKSLKPKPAIAKKVTATRKAKK